MRATLEIVAGGFCVVPDGEQDVVEECMALIRREGRDRTLDVATGRAAALWLATSGHYSGDARYAYPIAIECYMRGFRLAARELQLISWLTYPRYLRTRAWALVRAEALGASPACRCGTTGLGLTVHHLTYDRCGWEHPADVVVLCGECHRTTHSLAWLAPTPPRDAIATAHPFGDDELAAARRDGAVA